MERPGCVHALRILGRVINIQIWKLYDDAPQRSTTRWRCWPGRTQWFFCERWKLELTSARSILTSVFGVWRRARWADVFILKLFGVIETSTSSVRYIHPCQLFNHADSQANQTAAKKHQISITEGSGPTSGCAEAAMALKCQTDHKQLSCHQIRVN